MAVDPSLDRYAEHSYEEIGQALGITCQAARSTAARAMRKLQRLRGTPRYARLIETARELAKVKDGRIGNQPWNEPEAEDN